MKPPVANVKSITLYCPCGCETKGQDIHLYLNGDGKSLQIEAQLLRGSDLHRLVIELEQFVWPDVPGKRESA